MGRDVGIVRSFLPSCFNCCKMSNQRIDANWTGYLMDVENNRVLSDQPSKKKKKISTVHVVQTLIVKASLELHTLGEKEGRTERVKGEIFLRRKSSQNQSWWYRISCGNV